MNFKSFFLDLETTKPGDGFKGCVFRAQFDNIYPLKRVFQDPRPSYITLDPAGGEITCHVTNPNYGTADKAHVNRELP